jgi:transcription termination/antitermination protein NusA
MKSEFALAFNEIAEHSKLKREIILDALENAMVTAYRKAVNASAAQHVVVKVDPNTGGIKVYAEKEVVDEVQEANTEVTLTAAREVDPEAQLGDMVTVESTPRNFGRIAAQAAKQVILQRIREAERESQYQEYVQREGDIVNGTVQSVSAQGVTLGLGRTEATLPRNQMVPGERYHAHEKVRAYVLEVRKTTRGPQIIVSRSHKNMLRRLLEYEVPEIYNGAVEIKSIAREPGQRSKVAVAALQEGVDPVGACVGMRGVRIQSIVRELNDEKIDVIEWNPDQAVFIAKALSPARVTSVYLDDDPISGRTAMVVVPDDQLSLAIGREGQNARLAAKLTGWRIDIKSLTEAATDAYRKLRELPAFADTATAHPEIYGPAENILAKKAEGKPIPPEEYQLLSKMVELVEKNVARGRQQERAAKVEKVAAIKATIPAPAYAMLLADAKLPDRVLRALLDVDFKNVGQVMEQMALDEDRILALEGFGPKMLDELKVALAAVILPEPPAPEVVAEAPASPETQVAAGPEAAAAQPAAAEVAPALAEAQPAGAPATAAAAQPATTGVAAELTAAPAGEAAPAAEGEEEPEAEGEEGEAVTAEEGDEAADKDSDDDDKKKGKKKSKKKGAVEITFDEDLGMFITRKKRKPGRAKDEVFGLLEDE